MNKNPEEHLDIAEIRAQLADAKGPAYWKGLEEIARTEKFRQYLAQEHPTYAAIWESATNRRQFLTLMGASLALAGLAGCKRALPETIVPYVAPPEEITAGDSLYFATAMPLQGFANGLIVESHGGRPTKVEGNPDHPASLGATDIFAQASMLGLYDPDRSQVPVGSGELSTWERFVNQITLALQKARLSQGATFRILTGTVTSPTLASQIQALLQAYPEARWCQYEATNRDNVRAGARMAFGTDVDVIYDFRKADVILSLDADFLGLMPGSLRYTREFTDRRRQTALNTVSNRLYMAEASPTVTGTMAEHRWPMLPSDVRRLAETLASDFRVESGLSAPATFSATWLDGMVRDLRAHAGRSLVIAGEQQPPVVHAIAHAINSALGNVGTTVHYIDPVEPAPAIHSASLHQLAADMQAGKVELLLILGGNPVFDAPADIDFGALMRKVQTTVHVSLYRNETSFLSRWHLPEAHYLEAWGDARGFDGTASIMQPLILPLYSGRSYHEVLSIFAGKPGRPGLEIVREYWQTRHSGADFESWWRRSVHDGLVADTASPTRAPRLVPDFARAIAVAPAPQAAGLEIAFRPDPTILDGRFANNGWLQELPKPLTLLTWDNAALVAPSTAERLKLQSQDVVAITSGGRSLEMPVWIVPGHPANSVTLHYGYGTSRMGNVALGCGTNVYRLRTSIGMDSTGNVELRKTGRTRELACVQIHHNMEGRDPVRKGTVEEFRRDPEFIREATEAVPAELSLYPRHTELDGEYGWGMSIDLSVCTGCNACVVACQSENNIPVVGRAEVMNRREMHWIRIDRYYSGDLDNPETLTQPLPCMHCENAPCEQVCPVEATTHSSDGLNVMTYNRCVGTRYCANNCPYKVRRFNFLQYSDYDTAVLDLMRNPEVTVRSRGVMEKCTYCVQRINAHKIESEKEDRPIRDGEIQTACQQVCPAQAIVFGNVNDRGSQVSRLKASPLSYGLLTELNTRPRTTYLARITNPNPEITK